MNCNVSSKIEFFQNKLTLSINNQQFVRDINSDEIYALTIEPLKHIPDHYHVKLLFEHNNKPSKEKIIKEKPNGKFVQCIDIYTMLDKIDTSSITKWSNYPSFLFIDKRSSYAKHNENHFQLLNLDYASGFDILSQYTNEHNKNVTQHFFHVSYKKTDIVITYRNTFVNITEKDPKIPVSIVFNYLVDYYSIEVNIAQMINAVTIAKQKQIKHSSKIINTIKFITENKLDNVA